MYHSNLFIIIHISVVDPFNFVLDPDPRDPYEKKGTGSDLRLRIISFFSVYICLVKAKNIKLIIFKALEKNLNILIYIKINLIKP